MDSTGDSEDMVLDSAEYLFNNTKYHDRQVTVGDPSLDNLEQFGVVTVHLVSQSSVFRAMFEDSMLADQTGQNTCITDINPDIFKLMLRFLYGGKMPLVPKNTLADLLTCADKYNIQPLVKWCSKRLVLTSVDDLFPALMCAAYVNLPDLPPHVTKLIQEQTVQVLNNKRFFQLDDMCLELIAMQQTLAVTESQLWESLVRWAKAKADDPSEQRRLLTKPLKHVRFLTFTQDQIVKDVMNTNILSSAEFVHILSAVTNNQAITMPGLCRIKEKRILSGASCLPLNKPDVDIRIFKYPSVLHCYFSSRNRESIQAPEYKHNSSFSIRCSPYPVLLQCFTISTRSTEDEKSVTYDLNCSIKIFIYGHRCSVKETYSIECAEQVVSGMGDLELNLKLKNGQPLIIDPKMNYKFNITFNEPHPVFYTYDTSSTNRIDVTNSEILGVCVAIKHATPYHVKEIKYNTSVSEAYFQLANEL